MIKLLKYSLIVLMLAITLSIGIILNYLPNSEYFLLIIVSVICCMIVLIFYEIIKDIHNFNIDNYSEYPYNDLNNGNMD